MRTFLFIIALAVYTGPALAGGTEAAAKFYDEGNWKAAIAEYSVLAQTEDPGAEVLARLATSYLYSGDKKSAARAARSALKRAPGRRTEVVAAMVAAARSKRKIKKLQGLLDKYGPSPDLLNALGLAFLKHDDFDRSRGYFEEATRLDPADHMPIFFMGQMLELEHRFDDAIPMYKRALALNPRFAPAVNNLGYSYKERHYYSYAIPMYRLAISIVPDNAGSHYNLGNALSHKDMIKEALSAYQRAVDLSPKFAKAHYNLGRSYIKLGDLQRGLAELRLYLKYWSRALRAVDAPEKLTVKEEIETLEELIEEDRARRMEQAGGKG